MKPFVFILLSTFVIGLLTGVYLYFESRSTEPIFDFGGDELTVGFEVIADEYGGCQLLGGCASYRITDDGTYIYLVSHRNVPDERHDGFVESDSFEALKYALEDAPLGRIADSEFEGTCPIASDGLAYRYEIRVGENSYNIDTCREDTEGEQLFELLEDYFVYFREEHYNE